MAADTRDRLIDAADRLMWQRGYEAVGVAELCTAAGAPRGSFYHWFPSKQALTLAMLQRSWTRLRATLFEPAFLVEAPFAQQLDTYVGLVVAHLRRARREFGHVSGCRFGTLGAEMSTRDPMVGAAIAAIFDDMCSIFAVAIDAAVSSGELPAGTHAGDAAEALCAHMEGLMLLAKTRDDPAVLQRLSADGRVLVGLPIPAGRVATRKRATRKQAIA